MRFEALFRKIARCVALAAALLLLPSSMPIGRFPEIDRNKLLISLQRTACYGSCPDYTVTIDGNGNVVFSSRPPLKDPVARLQRYFSNSSGVRVRGRYGAKISEDNVDALVVQFRQADFFSLKDEYRAGVTDSPTHILTIDTGNGSKTVVDYVGEKAGMPSAVSRLQDAIDGATGSDRWIEGTSGVIPLLQSAGTRFDGAIGLELMAASASRDDIAAMEKLESLGAPLSAREGASPLLSAIFEKRDKAFGWLVKKGVARDPGHYEEALKLATLSDNHLAFDALVKAPPSGRIDKALASELLVLAAHNADPGMVRLLLARGAESDGPKIALPASDPPLFEAANGIGSNHGDHSAADRLAVVEMLLAAGASVTSCRYEVCDSVLWEVSEPAIAQTLIRAGADPDYRDEEGEHILFNISDERVALVLIARGADLKVVRPADRMTLRKWAVYQKWPKVLKLLDQAGL